MMMILGSNLHYKMLMNLMSKVFLLRLLIEYYENLGSNLYEMLINVVDMRKGFS